jgi:predicted transcriptional regulator
MEDDGIAENRDLVLQCLTPYSAEHIMTATVTIRLDEALQKRLTQLSKSTGRTRSDLVREALERQLAVFEFERTRSRTRPFAERAGFLTDDDVFRVVS